jgi:hypothetical protein
MKGSHESRNGTTRLRPVVIPAFYSLRKRERLRDFRASFFSLWRRGHPARFWPRCELRGVKIWQMQNRWRPA